MSKISLRFPYLVFWRFFVQNRPWRTYPDEALNLLVLGQAIMLLGGLRPIWGPWPTHWLLWAMLFVWLWAYSLLATFSAGIGYEWWKRRQENKV